MADERVLVVDDEPTVREVVATYLRRDGFAVDTAATGNSALDLLDTGRHDLVLLDIMLPGVSGLDILRRLRRDGGSTPVILLSARGDEADRVTGLELGADDYIVKPFSPREVAARVRSVLRRVGPPVVPEIGATLRFDGLEIDLGARQVRVNDQLAELTAKEFDVLAFLASQPRQVFTRAQLLERVWDSSADYQDPATVTVHVRRVRHKIEVVPEQPRWIETVWGVGYRFEP